MPYQRQPFKATICDQQQRIHRESKARSLKLETLLAEARQPNLYFTSVSRGCGFPRYVFLVVKMNVTSLDVPLACAGLLSSSSRMLLFPNRAEARVAGCRRGCGCYRAELQGSELMVPAAVQHMEDIKGREVRLGRRPSGLIAPAPAPAPAPLPAPALSVLARSVGRIARRRRRRSDLTTSSSPAGFRPPRDWSGASAGRISAATRLYYLPATPCTRVEATWMQHTVPVPVPVPVPAPVPMERGLTHFPSILAASTRCDSP